VVGALSGILDRLEHRRTRRVGDAAVYRDRDWCTRWRRFVEGQGHVVTTCAPTADLGIVDGPLDAADETDRESTARQVEEAVVGVGSPSRADSVVVSFAGARTPARHDRLSAVAGAPVAPADPGPYRAPIDAMGAVHRPATTGHPDGVGGWFPHGAVTR